MAKLTSKDIDQIRSSFGGLGEKVQTGVRDIYFHDCSHWRNSVMSAAWLPHASISLSELRRYEKFYSKFQAKGPFDSKVPYISMLGDDFYKLKSNVKTFKRAGWERSSKSTAWLCVWRGIENFELPKGFDVRFGHYFDPKFHRPFRKMMRENFKTTKVFLDELDVMHRTVAENVQTVIIYRKNRVAGIGLVATRKGGSYLYCGAIRKEFRRKGLWHVLVAARQRISVTSSDHIWTMVTAVPHLAKSAPLRRKIHTYKRTTETPD